MSLQLTQPVRKVAFGATVIDQFPIYGANGYTKVSGLVAGVDFTVVVYRNGAIFVIAVTVTEIGSTGEYKLSFTPSQVALWQVEVRYAAQQQTWKAEYDVAVEGALSGQIFYDTVRDVDGRGVGYVLVEALAAGTSTVLAETTTAFDGSYQFALSGLLAGNPLVDLRFSGSNLQTKTKTSLQLG